MSTLNKHVHKAFGKHSSNIYLDFSFYLEEVLFQSLKFSSGIIQLLFLNPFNVVLQI